MNLEIAFKNETYTLTGSYSNPELNGVEIFPDLIKTGINSWHLLLNGESFRILLIEQDQNTKTYDLEINGVRIRTQAITPLDKLLGAMGMNSATTQKATQLKSPMPGLVKSVLVQVGQTVEAGEPLIILEAMKMENVLKAPVQVTVRQIKVAAGDKVDKNSIMMLFEN